MGGTWSSLEEEPSPDPWWPATQSQPNPVEQGLGKQEVAEASTRERGRVREEELESFKRELACKRALRHEALAALQKEMKELRNRVEEEKGLRQKAEEERDRLRTSNREEVRMELEKERDENKKLLKEKERLLEEVEEKAALERQVQALKDVSEIGKEMLRIRELQVKELKKKLVEINLSSVMAPPEDLRIEYEKQIENIRKLRTLYEERAAATLLKHQQELEREEARITVLETKLSDLQKETEECKEAKKVLERQIEKLESTIQLKEDELEQTKDDLFSATVQNQSLNSQMNLINNLFSHMLVSPKVDLDRLIRILKENHGLITDLTEKGDSNEVAALLVDLAGQMEKEQEEDKNQDQSEISAEENYESQSEIASNLTKVWRVMVELLSHHQNSSHTELAGGAESCYKCIQTPTGPRSVISVSQTFLTLKDLILEKNRLVKEVGRLKTLNDHLEHRLGSQEKRLSVVTTELRKTWGVVNKLRAQHKQLHTHEKILRYELQQKRCMLTELKQELEHCRDKWERARQKNTQTEEDWKQLRKEFAARKSRKESNSAESGYEEEDVAHSPPSEPTVHGRDLFNLRPGEGSEPELSEEDIEHSDGNSFDTVIDLLDIACLENQVEGESEIPFVLCEVSPQTSEISPSHHPLTESEFTEGLDQIESEDLAAVLDVQYQNQLIGADYNLSLPSSSGSSPVPTENDDFASSEMDISEEDSSSIDNHIHSSPLPTVNQTVSEDTLLFGSNSSKNISKFLDGLFVDQQPNKSKASSLKNLSLDVPSTSQAVDENGTATPLVHSEDCYQFPSSSTTPLVNTEHLENYKFPENSHISSEEKNEQDKLKHVEQLVFEPMSNKSQNQVNIYTQDLAEPGSSGISSESVNKAQGQLLKFREERLKKLEQQCKSLVSRVTSTSFSSEILSNKLDELHLCYGSSEEVSDNEDELVHVDACKQKHSQAKLQEVEDNSCTNAVTDSRSIFPSAESNIQETTDVCTEKSEDDSATLSTGQRKTPEEILQARAERLKRLEDQCKSLFSKMSATSTRSVLISSKLDELHESFGPSEETTIVHQSNDSTTCLSARKSLSPEKTASLKCQEKEIVSNAVAREEHRDCKTPDLASESKQILNKCCLPGPSVEPIPVTNADLKQDRSTEEILEARAERFRRLEEQCKSLVSKMTATSLRSEIISNKLDELHSCYGSSEDASDNDEHSLSSIESDRRRPTPTSSPKHNRKMARSAEKDTHTGLPEEKKSSKVNEERVSERIAPPACPEPERSTHSNTDAAVQSKRTPEEIFQARAERLNRLEEQCKSLFSKMSATSQRSDVISNRLEELHGQYGQPSPSESETHSEPTVSLTGGKITRLDSDGDEESRILQNTNSDDVTREQNQSGNKSD